MGRSIPVMEATREAAMPPDEARDYAKMLGGRKFRVADLWIARREQRRQRARELRRIVATVPGRPGRPPVQRLDVRTALRRECGR